ncbi:MAG: threonine ammonia-lyase [Nitrospirae bacterium]|nr:threonine ammonia-lyase [Nitrospirota bacterium]
MKTVRLDPARLLKKIKEEYPHIQKKVRHTPMIETSLGIPELKLPVHLKLENFQKTGSFKTRGAFARLRSLSLSEKKRGIISASAGNHAQGVALAAKWLGIQATLIMPENASLAKQEATRSYGAEVILKGKHFEGATEFALRLAETEHKTFIPPFDDERIIAGQGSLGIEILKDLPDVSALFVPIGGGGLIGGIATCLKLMKPKIKMIGVKVKPKTGGSAQSLPIADGIAVKQAGRLTAPLINRYVDEIVFVSEEEISSAILLLMERRKIVAEGAGAASVAGFLKVFPRFNNEQAVLLISGGNIDVTLIEKILEKGLVKEGRLFRFQIEVEDVPGVLATVTRIIADEKANILDIVHDRYSLQLPLNRTRIEFSLETKGPAHFQRIQQSLKKEGFVIRLIS